MIKPAPTAPIDKTLARAIVVETIAPKDDKPAGIVLAFANTNYRMRLALLDEAGLGDMRPREKVVGTIHAKAKRVDVCGAGGRYVEPVFGRPRRVQGWIVAVDEAANTIVVNAGMPIHCELTAPGQRAGDFQQGDLVTFDVFDAGVHLVRA